MIKDLHLNSEAEWEVLKMALCHLLYLSSCYESLENDSVLSRDLLYRIGVENIPSYD